jgi:NADH:ubiquinone oxidoreductase subunit K
VSLVFYVSIITVILVLVTGIYSLLTTKNLIRMVISLEILMKSVTLFIIVIGYVIGKPEFAQTMVVTMIVIEVVTVSVAAGIAVGLYRRYNTLNIQQIRSSKVKEE